MISGDLRKIWGDRAFSEMRLEGESRPPNQAGRNEVDRRVKEVLGKFDDTTVFLQENRQEVSTILDSLILEFSTGATGRKAGLVSHYKTTIAVVAAEHANGPG